MAFDPKVNRQGQSIKAALTGTESADGMTDFWCPSTESTMPGTRQASHRRRNQSRRRTAESDRLDEERSATFGKG